MSIIGISGKIGSGKDLVAKMIQYIEEVPEEDIQYALDNDCLLEDLETEPAEDSRQIVRFADKLKDTVCLWLECTREQLEDREFKEKPLGKEWDKWKICINKEGNGSLQINGSPKYYSSKEEAEKVAEGWDVFIHRVQMTPRKLMQLLGTECGREIIHPDIWVNATMAEYDKPDFIQQLEDGYHEINQKQWIIPDTRFPNEAQAVKDKNGVVIRVERSLENRFPEIAQEYGYVSGNPREMESMLDGYIHREYPELYKKIHHESETALDGYEDFDYVLYNNFSIKTLFESVKEILEQEEII